MKKLFISFIGLIALLTGCNQGASSEDIANLAYEWEKANFDRDYEQQQKYIYEEGSYEAYKGDEKIDSGLKYGDIRYEIYFDERIERYYIFTDFKNPNGENSVEDNIVLRKKDEEWKVDTSESLDIVRKDISEKFAREACINCK
ncbi:lipoprotein [Peribacillus loiseleuriae]|uniref:DUF4878 domain-containing protein n=1 Tax=Peribacillus loiseleuriae TaxID=1679170 RepID=A0A0K9G457_9BACI|nr:lipoprotein [Peribacillus loiseleuriae]KMY41489.1 hypothetical protein AC625_24715 [Peribacillus loiseleuriae]